MNFVAAILLVVIVFLAHQLLDRYLTEKRRKESIASRLAPDGSVREYNPSDMSIGLDSEPSERGKAIARLLTGMGVNVDDSLRKLERDFAQAGVLSTDGPYYYLFFQRIISLFLLIAALMLFMSPAKGMDQILNILVGIMVAVAALFGPQLYIKNRIMKRQKVLLRAFPDTLDLLLICVESGLALDAALNRVTTELGRAYPEMTEELNRTRFELSLLNDRVRALMNLGERTNMVAFRSLVASLIQSERFGTSLSDTLRVLSEDFRLQRVALAEAKAARLPVMMTVPLILLLIPAFFLVLLGPVIVNILKVVASM
jgi:tight adherence protein C